MLNYRMRSKIRLKKKRNEVSILRVNFVIDLINKLEIIKIE